VKLLKGVAVFYIGDKVVKWKIIGLCGVFLIMFVVSAMLPGRTMPSNEVDERVQTGWHQWRSHNCVSCHSLYGLGGHIGPDLTDVTERWNAEFVQAKIRGGGAGMPAFPDADVEALTTYLAYMSSSGTYPPTKWPAPSYGEGP